MREYVYIYIYFNIYIYIYIYTYTVKSLSFSMIPNFINYDSLLSTIKANYDVLLTSRNIYMLYYDYIRIDNLYNFP